MASAVYLLGTLTTFLCAVLLLRQYSRVGLRLLLWSGLCFAGLTLNNALVFVDRVLLPDADIYLLRLWVTTLSMVLLVFGLIWESESS